MQTNTNLKPLKYDDADVGQWVIVLYEDEKFIGKVIKKGEWEFNGKTKKSFMLRCLEKPLVLRHHSVMRKETLFFTIPCTERINPLSNTSGGKREEKERVSLDILTGSCLD